jgi:hypothetical protein
MPLQTNRADLVASSIVGRIAPPRIHPEVMNIDENGRAFYLPGTGGIALGVHAGDLAAHWVADHLMPGASIEDAVATPAQPGALHLLSCIGNRVRDAAGRTIGVVAGKRGGLAPGAWAPQLVGVEVCDAIAATLNCEDRVIVETLGRGLKLVDHPGVTLCNLSPRLLDALPLAETRDALTCDVCAVIPPEAAGAGLGQDSWVGDLEITDHDLAAGLRFGDLVAFTHMDSTVSRHFHPGTVSIGLVSHGSSPAPGHGVGVTILMTAKAEHLRPVIGQGGLAGLLMDWSTDPKERRP